MNIEELEKLNTLKEKGILTQEEFDAKKKVLLDAKETNVAKISSVPTPNKSLWGYFLMCITRKYLSCNGRARRKEFWGYTLFAIIAKIIIICAIAIVAVQSGDLDEKEAYILGEFTGRAVSLFFLFPGLAVLSRRFNDVGLSIGWAVLIIPLFIVPFLPSEKKENESGPIPEGVIEKSR